MLEDASLGEAGREILVESFLQGEELSLFAITNGRDVTLLPAAQDHKRLLEGDQGPNTGGMGAYAPVSLATSALLDRATSEVLLPTLGELERRGTPFRGLLYAGLMIDANGAPSVVEFNCRFGDPETQAVLPLLGGGLVDALTASAEGTVLPKLAVNPQLAAVTTVLAARGYPDAPEKGAEITLPSELPDGVTIFHAGTRRDDAGVLRSSGGRVLTVTGVGATFADARARSADVAERVQFEGKQYRRDIGWREARR
jgi:phosphoribosylamine--glycine ligase